MTMIQHGSLDVHFVQLAVLLDKSRIPFFETVFNICYNTL